MCKAMEDIRKEECKKIAKQLLAAGELSKDKIAKYFGLTPSEIEALAK